jgi:hypothetical protein
MCSLIQRSTSARLIPVLLPVAGPPVLSMMVKDRPMRVSRNPSPLQRAGDAVGLCRLWAGHQCLPAACRTWASSACSVVPATIMAAIAVAMLDVSSMVYLLSVVPHPQLLLIKAA